MSDCDCNARPYAPVAPTSTCTGDYWLGFEKLVHKTALGDLATYADDGATAVRINRAGVDLFVSCNVGVAGGAGSPTDFELELALHTNSTGAGKKAIARRSTDLQEEPDTTLIFEVQGFIPAGAYWSLRINDASLASSFTFYQIGAKA